MLYYLGMWFISLVYALLSWYVLYYLGMCFIMPPTSAHHMFSCKQQLWVLP